MVKNFEVCFLLLILSPLLGLFVNFLFFGRNSHRGSCIATVSVWIGAINALITSVAMWLLPEKCASIGVQVGGLTWVMSCFIVSISAVIHHFSLSYMAGDRNYRRYFLYLTTITISTLLMVAADNVIVMTLFWMISNSILVLLMIHKVQWKAAKNSGIIAFKTFMLGAGFLLVGVGLLAYESGSSSLETITTTCNFAGSTTKAVALFCIMVAAFSQSGAWPFHGWLLSSLNSPTPVSAFMHAGLVNGGGILLVRFAPVFLQEPYSLHVLFVFGLLTLVLGGIWKLLQSDIKRMLACSTITQMGFMIMQCGLGLFPAAFAHICWHGLFKAFLFLRSGSTVSEKKQSNDLRVSTISTFFLASFCGLMGASGFAIANGLSFYVLDATAILIFFCWMASTQLAHALLEKNRALFFVLLATAICFTTGFAYGITVDTIEKALGPMQMYQPQSLHFLHIIGAAIVFCIWLMLNLKPFANHEGAIWWRRFYVKMLNASQPNPVTITSIKNAYKF